MKVQENIQEKEIHDIFTATNEGGPDRIFGVFELKQAEIMGGARFMDFTRTGTVISMN